MYKYLHIIEIIPVNTCILFFKPLYSILVHFLKLYVLLLFCKHMFQMGSDFQPWSHLRRKNKNYFSWLKHKVYKIISYWSTCTFVGSSSSVHIFERTMSDASRSCCPAFKEGLHPHPTQHWWDRCSYLPMCVGGGSVPCQLYRCKSHSVQLHVHVYHYLIWSMLTIKTVDLQGWLHVSQLWSCRKYDLLVCCLGNLGHVNPLYPKKFRNSVWIEKNLCLYVVVIDSLSRESWPCSFPFPKKF